MTTQHSNARRSFLRTLTSAAGGTAALAAASQVVHAAPEHNEQVPAPSTAPASKGYQRSEHVETYYQLADF